MSRRGNSPARVSAHRPITRSDYPSVFGDFDRDQLPDVDDPRPTRPGDTESIEEVRLADEMQALLDTRAEFMPVEAELRTTLTDLGVPGAKIKSRVKTPYSILNKLRRKRLGTLTDIAGGMMIVPDQRTLEQAAAGIEREFDVIERLDYYEHPQNGYRALHYVVSVNDKPVELQLKTRRMAEIAKASHTAYKQGKLDPTAMEEMTALAWDADRGNKSAVREIDAILSDPAKLRAALRTANPRRDCALMPEDPWAYFTKPSGTVLMRLDELTPTRARKTGIRNAEKYMKAACAGDHERRKPITVDPDTLEVLDGNSTYAVARAWGWREIPVQFERRTNPSPTVRALARRLAQGG